MPMKNLKLIISLFLLLSVISCDSQPKVFSSPAGYNLNKPEKFRMPSALHEISGLAFINGAPDTIYTEEDNDGKIFHFSLANINPIVTRFAGKGDFEDISICDGFVVMLRSDGVLFTIPLQQTQVKEAVAVQKFEQLLPAGEYEGLASDASGKIYALCKHCEGEKTSKLGGGYIFQLSGTGGLVAAGDFSLDIKSVEKLTGGGKIKFHPSALAQHPVDHSWYILSGVNKLLVITDPAWNVKEVYPLNPALFPQPEGIAFDKNNNLYISNERNTTAYATILKFKSGAK